MNRILMHIFLVVTLLYGFLGSVDRVEAQSYVETGGAKSEHQIKQNEGYLGTFAEESRNSIEVAFRSTPSSHRVASSRPTRLLPTHGGGKPGGHLGHWTANAVFKPLKNALLQPCHELYYLHMVVASPRLRYVIALRRLLC
ncbi:MAG: hypothetical protein J5735_04235 [Prevotella sp.]|nr:hypothetical protein [Prevotella sp.]